MVYKIFKGKIPAGLMVCHTCDVRNCINPDHLFLGTAQDNSTDMVQKGRVSRTSKNAGDSHPGCKLKGTDILRIRKLFKAGSRSRLELAKAFKITKTHVCRIINRQSWGHI